MILNFCHPDLNFFQRPIEIRREDLVKHIQVIDHKLADKIGASVTSEFHKEIELNGGKPTQEAIDRREYLFSKSSRMVEALERYLEAQEDLEVALARFRDPDAEWLEHDEVGRELNLD